MGRTNGWALHTGYKGLATCLQLGKWGDLTFLAPMELALDISLALFAQPSPLL